MVSNLDNENDEEREEALEAIQNDPLSVEVRSGWHSVGSTFPPDEFCILLCWGGHRAGLLEIWTNTHNQKIHGSNIKTGALNGLNTH